MFQAMDATTRNPLMLSKKRNQDSIKWCSSSIPSENVSGLLLLNTVRENNLKVDVTSPNQPEQRKQNYSSLLIAKLWARYSQNTLEQPNTLYQTQFFQIQQLKLQNKGISIIWVSLLLNFGQTPNTSELTECARKHSLSYKPAILANYTRDMRHWQIQQKHLSFIVIALTKRNILTPQSEKILIE